MGSLGTNGVLILVGHGQMSRVSPAKTCPRLGHACRMESVDPVARHYIMFARFQRTPP